MPISAPFKSLWKRKKPARQAAPQGTVPLRPAAVPTQPRRVEEPLAGLPRFHTTAADHIDRERADRYARERVKLRSSFTPSQPIADPRMFAGRRDMLEVIISAVEDQKSHVVLFGDRGVGKTSLLHMIARAASEAKYIVVYFSCGASSDFSETFRTVAAEIPLLFHGSISPTSERTEGGTTLADLLGDGKLTPRLFGDAAAKIVGTRVLVMLDEFDRAESAEFRRDVAELIKSLSDVSARLQLVIGGVAADLVELMEHIPSIRRNVTAIRVAAMSDDEVSSLVNNGAKMSGITFDREATELVVGAARGSPYLTNLLCHVSGMVALDAGRLRVEADDVGRALDDAIEEFRIRLPAEFLRHLDQAIANGEIVANLQDAPSPESVTLRKADLKKAQIGTGLSARLAQQLERDGVLQNAKPATVAILIDSITPYLQLRSARDRFKREAA